MDARNTRPSLRCSTRHECKQDKWNRGLDLFVESVLKPDPSLRQCAHNQRCYHELMDVRQDVLKYLNSLRWH